MKNSVCLDPYNEYSGFSERFLKLLDLDGFSGTSINRWTPSSDIYEDGEGYLLGFEMPGIKKEDLEIRMKDRKLTISGERKRKEREGVWKKREIVYGKFEGSYILPEDADSKKIEASLKDGILELRIGKLEAKGVQKIPVK